MIEKMKGKCLPLRDLTAEQIEKVKEVLNCTNCHDYKDIEVGSKYSISYYEYDKVGVFKKQDYETPISFSEFLEIFEPFNPKRGDWVSISKNDDGLMINAVFICEIEGLSKPIITVCPGQENTFFTGGDVSILQSRYVKPYVKPKFTHKEVCEKFGVNDFELI